MPARPAVVAAVLGCALFLLSLAIQPPQPASAHAEYVSSAMEPCSVVDGSNLSIEFSEDVEPDDMMVSVVGQSGGQVALGRLDLEGLTRSRVLFELAQPLDPGSYWIEWTIRSAVDGDLSAGRLGFGVDSEPPLDCALDEASPPGASDSSSVVVFALGLLSAFGLGGVFLLVRRSTTGLARGDQANNPSP